MGGQSKHSERLITFEGSFLFNLSEPDTDAVLRTKDVSEGCTVYYTDNVHQLQD